jgi:hypothetical protein
VGYELRAFASIAADGSLSGANVDPEFLALLASAT